MALHFHGESRQLFDRGLMGAKEIAWTDEAHLKYTACWVCVWMPWSATLRAACPPHEEGERA